MRMRNGTEGIVDLCLSGGLLSAKRRPTARCSLLARGPLWPLQLEQLSPVSPPRHVSPPPRPLSRPAPSSGGPMSVMNSPVDLRTHDDHLKELLGQRAARADLHARYPSLSEFSDSPSVYSHSHFSPRPPDRPFLDSHPHSFRSPHSPKVYSPSLSDSPRSPISDRERLNIPNASSLDLEDDPRSSSELNSLRDDDGDSPPETEEAEIPRISMYGPKMRFHSPAPWEEDEDAKSIPEEPVKRSKKKSDTGKKGWGLSRANGESRPSTDSSRSGSKGKQSFDAASTFSANGALAYVL